MGLTFGEEHSTCESPMIDAVRPSERALEASRYPNSLVGSRSNRLKQERQQEEEEEGEEEEGT